MKGGQDCHGPVQPHTLNCPQKCFRVPSCREAEINHLTVCVDSPPQIAPLAANSDIGLANILIDVDPAQIFFRSFGQFRSEFLNPAIYSRPISGDLAFLKQIHHILVVQRVARIPPHCAKDDATRKTGMLERRPTRHAQPQKHKTDRR